MRLTSENVAETYYVSREEQETYTVESHHRVTLAQQHDKFDDKIIPLQVKQVTYSQKGPHIHTTLFDTAELLCPDTTAETLAKLPTVLKANGTVTVGTSAPLSDSIGFVVGSDEKVKALGATPFARFVDFKAVAVAPKLMGFGPVFAIPKVVKLTNLTIEDTDLVELNEVFASLTLASTREVGLKPQKTNVNGGVIELGHPLGTTGAILTARLLAEMRKLRTHRMAWSQCVLVSEWAQQAYLNSRSRTCHDDGVIHFTSAIKCIAHREVSSHGERVF